MGLSSLPPGWGHVVLGVMLLLCHEGETPDLEVWLCVMSLGVSLLRLQERVHPTDSPAPDTGPAVSQTRDGLASGREMHHHTCRRVGTRVVFVRRH